MSVGIAFKDGDRFVVGVDSRISSDEYYRDSYKERPKGIKLKNGIVLACSGNIALLDLFAKKFEVFDKLDRETILYKAVIPFMRDYNGFCFMENGNALDGALIVAMNDKCFLINSIGTVEEVYKYNAIGSGKMTALGSLYSTCFSNTDAEEKVALAIKAAGANVPSVSSEAWIADTKELEFTLM